MAELKVASDVRVNQGFEDKLKRDIKKIEDMSPKNTSLHVVLKRTQSGGFETEMESIGFPKRLFSKAQATNAFAAFKQARDHLIKQLRRQVKRRRDMHTRVARATKRWLRPESQESANEELAPASYIRD